MLTSLQVATNNHRVELGLTVDEVLTTTRSVRKRLDLERAVDREVVVECLRTAFQAPNGSNQQMWGWVCVDDPTTKSAMADIYRAGLAAHLALSQRERGRTNDGRAPVDDRQELIGSSVAHLVEHLQDVPVLVVPTVLGRLDGASIFDQASRWGSILPATWSFMLALRSRGLGSAWTTLHLHREAEMAELLGIPFGRATQAGLFPVAYTIGTDFKPASRAMSDRTIRWNHWDAADIGEEH